VRPIVGIAGPGATGTVLAGSFLRAGFRVRLLARDAARAGRIRRGGLKLDGRALRGFDAVSHRAPDLAPCDAVILCVKSEDTRAALPALARMAGGGAPVLSIQNGLGHADLLRRLFGPRAVMGSAYFGALREPDGSIRRLGGRRIELGLAPRNEAHVRFLRALLARAGWVCRAAGPEGDLLWGKLVLNAAINPLGALARCPNGELLRRPALRDLLVRAAEEAGRLARRAGARPGFKRSGAAALRLASRTAGNLNSMAQDLEAGRPTEAGAILGPLLKAARDPEREAPVLSGLFRFVKGLERAVLLAAAMLAWPGSGVLPAGAAPPAPQVPRAQRAAAAEGTFFTPGPEPEALFTVFQGEMDRSMAKLRLDDFGPPHFLAYRLIADRNLTLRAYFGEMSYRFRSEVAVLYAEARYGTPAFDNVDDDYNGAAAHAPVDPDPDALKQKLWELTDEAYRRAVAGYLSKKAKLARELVQEKLEDLSPAPQARRVELRSAGEPPLAELEGRLRRVSALFKAHPHLQDAEASLRYSDSTRFLLTTEGTRLATPEENLPVVLYVGARTRAPDGMGLEQFSSWVAPSLDALPSEAEMAQAAERVAKDLKALREAELQPPFTAPAIFDPEFTGVFFHEALGHKLEGQRQREPEESQLFKGRVGESILPAFLSLVDDPALAEYRGIPLNGHYRFDSEGVPSARVSLIERGVLRGFLMSRRPVPGASGSNGHGRSDAWRHPIGRMGTLILEAHETVPRAGLKARLQAECRRRRKPYGFWLKGAFGGDNPSHKSIPQTLRVHPKLVVRVDAETGMETLVRGVEFVGTPLVVVNKILAAGDDPEVNNAGRCGAASGWVPVSEIAPSLLVSEAELQRLPENRERPPLLPSPLHDR